MGRGGRRGGEGREARWGGEGGEVGRGGKGREAAARVYLMWVRLGGEKSDKFLHLCRQPHVREVPSMKEHIPRRYFQVLTNVVVTVVGI